MKVRRHRQISLFSCILLASNFTAYADTSAANEAAAPGVPPAAAPAPPPSVPHPAPANQIWECTTNGVRTFSNNPCGTHPTVRELNPINVMEPDRIPMYRVTHTYAPPATPAAPSDAEGSYADNAYNATSAYIVVNRSHRLRNNALRNHARPHH